MELLTDPIFMAVAVIGVCLLGISKGGFLGLGVMALPLMSLFVPPLQAAAIILPTAIAQDFLTLWVYRREWSAWNLKIMLPSMFVGMFVAWLMAASLSAAHIRLAIGLIAALFVLRHWPARRFERWIAEAERRDRHRLRRDRRRHHHARQCRRAGLADSSAAAEARQAALHRHGRASCSRRATSSKSRASLTLGFLTRDNMLIGLTLVPIAVLANYAGIWMVRRVSTEMFFRIAYILMFVIAVELIRSSVVDLWWR